MRIVFLTVIWCAVITGRAELKRDWVANGWGVDAILSSHVSEREVPSYLALLHSSGVKLVRERDTGRFDLDAKLRDYTKTYKATCTAGFEILAIAQENRDLGQTAWGPFPQELRIVFEEGIRLGERFAETVSAWELHNEPELAWWPDMPDRYAAHAKALYLGLKAGTRSTGRDAPVLLGSLGLPAGPWLERSALNGLLDYADAWNVHYYGDATQFTGFLNSHVQAMRDLLEKDEGGDLRPQATRRWPVKNTPTCSSLLLAPRFRLLPIWATEVGVNTVTSDTWADPVRRRRQADWILSTAKQALAHPQVAVFMPFVLVHKEDGYALTESATETWPAWDEYSRFTRENPFPPRPAIRPRASVNPVVLQWLADSQTTSGHKLAAAYRWRADGKPIQGELRIYNFGDRSVSGRLRQTREPRDGTGVATAVPAVSAAVARPGRTWLHGNPGTLTIPAGGMLSLPLSFALEDSVEGGRREWRQFSFIDESGLASQLGFALERSPELFPPSVSRLDFADWGELEPRFDYVPHAVRSEASAGWKTINGVRVEGASGGLVRFQLGDRPFDPEYPPMASARLTEGLPAQGWLRVAMRELGPAGVRIRVDLVDKDGRRFTQWENLGQVRGLSATAPRWLNLLDFHPYAWGKLDEQRRLKPAEVREVQLRFYASKGPTLVDVELGFARDYGNQLDPSGEVPVREGGSNVSAPVE